VSGPRFKVGDHVEQFINTVHLRGTVIGMDERTYGWVMDVRVDDQYGRTYGRDIRRINQAQLRLTNVLDRLARET